MDIALNEQLEVQLSAMQNKSKILETSVSCVARTNRVQNGFHFLVAVFLLKILRIRYRIDTGRLKIVAE